MTTWRGARIAAVVLCLAASSPVAHADPEHAEVRGERAWSVSLTVGVPELSALRVSRRIGPRWRLSVDLGNMMMIVTGGIHANRVFARRRATTFYAGLSASAVLNTGCGYDECVDATWNYGGGPHLGARWTSSWGVVLGIDAGVLAGRWPDFYERDLHVLPLVMGSAGYSW